MKTYLIDVIFSFDGVSARICSGDKAMQVLVQANNDNDAIVQGCRLGMRLREELRLDKQFIKRLTVSENPLPRVDVDGYLLGGTQKFCFKWDCDSATTLHLELERATGQAMPALQAA